MATATAGIDLLTTAQIGAEVGAADWAVRKTLDDLGIAARVGRHRVIERGDLPLVVEELDRRGYLMCTVASGGDAVLSVSSGVAGPSNEDAPGVQARGASMVPSGVALLKGDGERRSKAKGRPPSDDILQD